MQFSVRFQKCIINPERHIHYCKINCTTTSDTKKMHPTRPAAPLYQTQHTIPITQSSPGHTPFQLTTNSSNFIEINLFQLSAISRFRAGYLGKSVYAKQYHKHLPSSTMTSCSSWCNRNPTCYWSASACLVGLGQCRQENKNRNSNVLVPRYIL